MHKVASPQKENGFTSIANELLEVIYRSPFTLNELRILLFIIRETYGYQRIQKDLSIRYIDNGTGIGHRNIHYVLKDLEKMKVIIISDSPNHKQRKSITFNKNYDEWIFENRSRNKNGSKTANRSSYNYATILDSRTEPVLKQEQKKKKERNINKGKNDELHSLQKFIKNELPEVSKLKKQLTYKECEKLLNDFTKPEIHEILLRMENYSKITKSYVSVNLTLRNWIKRDRESNNGLDFSVNNRKNGNSHNHNAASYHRELN